MKKQHMTLGIVAGLSTLPLTIHSIQIDTNAGMQQTTQQNQQQSPVQVIPQGPDTVQAPVEKIGAQGNWIKKREWLIKSHEVNNEIQDVAVQIEKTRKMYVNAHSNIDASLDAYYKQLGLDKGKLQELFDSIVEYTEKKKTREISTLTGPGEAKLDYATQSKIDLIENSAKDLRQQLDQLTLDMNSIEDLDKSLIDRMKRVDEQIAAIQEESNKASSIIQEMWNVVDHNKAREQYYLLKFSSVERVKSIYSYLKDDLFKDFESVTVTIKTQITRSQDQIKKLEEDGIFIQNRALRIKEAKEKKLLPLDQNQSSKKAEPNATDLEEKSLPWYRQLYEYLIAPFTFLYHAIMSIKEKLWGK